MLSHVITAICLASLLSSTQAWGEAANRDETPFRESEGQLVFVSSSGALERDASLTFDPGTKSVKMERFNAEIFSGDSINFRGREIRNAHLLDPSIENLKHLTVDSIALRSQDTPDNNGHGIAIVDGNGIVETTRQMRWDNDAGELKVPSLTSFSKSGLEIRSDVDFMSHKLKNVSIEANTTLRNLVFKDGVVENTVLRNVTATDLNLGDVMLDSLSISQFDSTQAVGSLIVVGEDGAIESTTKLKQERDGPFIIDGETFMDGSLTVSGSVLGSGPYVDVSDERFKRNIQKMNSSAELLEKILQLDGVSYELDSSRLKGHRLGQGSSNITDSRDRQIGFIAQDVEKIFPEVVSTDEDGFKGLQYSRFAPILVESLKQLTKEVRDLQKERDDMKRLINSLELYGL